MSEPAPEPIAERPAPWTAGGILLIVLGLIVAVPSGYFAVMSLIGLIDMEGPSAQLGWTIFPALIALATIVAGGGVFLIWAAFHGHRPSRAPAEASANVVPRRQWTAGAVALLVLGLVILVPSGLCTGLFALPLLSDFSREALSILGMAVMLGGPFIAVGIALVIGAFAVRPKR